LSQEGLRIVKLGSEDKILKSVQEVEMDPETIREVGRKYKVNAIFVGNLSISSIRPEIKIYRTEIFPPARSMRIKSEVELAMTAKLLETGNGSIVWTDSAQGIAKVANVRMLKKHETHARKFPRDGVYFEAVDAVDPEDAYGELVRHLIKEITTDLKVSYKRVWKGINLR
jgi:hypothetical protein